MSKPDFHKKARRQFNTDMDRNPKGKSEVRAYIRKKARSLDKTLIEEGLYDDVITEDQRITELINAEADEASYCHHYGPCEKCKARQKELEDISHG